MKKQTQKKFIYLRYILPPVLVLLAAAAMFIPSYKYVISGEMNEVISAFDLFGSSFTAARNVIFATEEQAVANMMFSQTAFWLIIVFALLWIVGLAVALYSAVIAIRYFIGTDEEQTEKSRTLFITFFPNRTVLCIFQSLILPLALFPYLMPMLFGKILGLNVSLVLCAPDLLIATLVVLAAIFVLSVFSAPMERRFNADMFKKHKPKNLDDSGEESTDERYNANINVEETDEQHAKRLERARQIIKKIDKNNKENIDDDRK